MRLVTEATAPAAHVLDQDIGQLLSLRRRVEIRAMQVLLAAMKEHDWSEIEVDPEELSLIEGAMDSTGARVELDEYALDLLNEQAVSIVGWCPRTLFRYRSGTCHVTTADLEGRLAS